MTIKVLTLFPEMFESVFSSSIIRRAMDKSIVNIELINIRDYAVSKHKNADDYPFGGGSGMVMLAQPIIDAIDAATMPPFSGPRVFMSPCGKTFTQNIAEEYAKHEDLLILCGHYEGVDQRAIDRCIDEEISIGDFILTGGEIPAMAVIDSVARLLPGVLGNNQSAQDESFSSGLLEYPQYTRPYDLNGDKAPDVLLSGNHAMINKWRRMQAIRITALRRPDILKQAGLTTDELEYAKQCIDAADYDKKT